MRIAAIVVIVAALAIGALTFILGKSYLESLTPAQPTEVVKPVAAVQVVVAAKNLPAGTIISDNDIRWQAWPDDSLDDAYIVQREGQGADRINELIGTVVRRGIAVGEPITMAKVFKREQGGYLAGMLSPGMRAVSVRINEVSGTAGFILPGDRVDVILTQELRQTGGVDVELSMRRASETILRNVRVLAVDQIINDFEEKAQVGKTVTLEVTPKQAEMLSVATSMGTLSLALRSLSTGPGDAYAGPFTSDFEVSRALSGGAEEGAERQVEATPFVPPAAIPRVLVAARDLARGTLLRDDDLRWQPAPDDAELEGLFAEGQASIAGLRGTLVKLAIAAGEPIAADRVIGPKEPGFLAAALTPGMRAFSIDISASPGVASLVAPGDRVDVVLTQTLQPGDPQARVLPRRASEVIVQNVRVLTMDAKERAAAIEVTPKQAAALATAMTMGQVSLTVRSTGAQDTGAVAATDVDVSSTLGQALSEMGAPAPAPVAPTAPRVLSAAKPLAKGSLLRESDLVWSPGPEGASFEDFFVEGLAERRDLRGALLTRDIEPGAALAVADLLRPGDSGFLAAVLGPGMRAVNINVGNAPGLSALVSPGDRVDVVLTHTVSVAGPDGKPTARRASETIIQDIRVITLDEAAGAAAIEVTPEQAAVLATAQTMGTVTLAVRSGEGPAGEAVAATDLEVSPALQRALAAAEAAPAAPQGRPTARVLAAARDLPEGALLRDSDLRWIVPPADVLTDDYFLEGRDEFEPLRGALIKSGYAAGQPIAQSSVITPDEPGFLAAAVRPGMRAVGIGLDAVSGINGLISPGDRVDVVLTSDVGERRFSETILQKVRVMAFNRERNSATVEVSPKQAEMLTVARTMGELSLALRSQGGEGEESQAAAFTTDADVSRALAERRQAQALAAQAAAQLGQPVAAAPARTRVLVAKHTLEAGTLLRDRDFEFEVVTTLPADDLDNYFVEGTANIGTLLRGALVTEPIAAGEPLVADKVIKPGEHGFLAAALRDGMRAVSVEIDPVTGVSGLVSPGDYVDVLLTTEIDDDTSVASLKKRRFTETVAQNVRVLAVEQTIDDATGKPVVGRTATLEVAPRDAEVLALAASMGRVSLSLRGENPGSPGAIGVTYTSDLGISLAASDLVVHEFDRRADDQSQRFAGSGRRAAAAPAPQMGPARVLVAAREVPAGTLLKGDDLRWRALAEGENAAGAYLEGRAEATALYGALVRRSLAAGTPLTVDALMFPDDPGFVTAALREGMRAVSVGAEAAAGIARFAVPGDRVDVVLTREVTETDASGGSAQKTVSEPILSGVRVLALDRESGGATIEVSSDQAATLAMATTMGRLTLALRGGAQLVAASSAPVPASAAPAPAANPIVPISATLGTTRVLAAARDLAKGDLLRDTDFRWATVPSGTPTEGYFVQGIVIRPTLAGALVRRDVAAGELLTEDDLLLAGEHGYVALALRPGMRAVSIAIDDVTGVSGFIAPGDAVDVLMTHEITDSDDQPILDPRRFTETIARNLRVLAIEQSVNPVTGKPVVGKTVTVEVTPKQSETLALGASIGKLSLALHAAAPGEDQGPKTPFTADFEISDATVAAVLRAEPIYRLRYPYIPTSPPYDLRYPRVPVIKPRAPQANVTEVAPPVAAPAPAPAASGSAVKVYRSNNPQTLQFSQ